MKDSAERLRKLRAGGRLPVAQPGQDWLAEQASGRRAIARLTALAGGFRVWPAAGSGAALLPVDQVVLTLAQDSVHRAVRAGPGAQAGGAAAPAPARSNPAWRLPELTEELAVIARNQRRFLGFSDDDTGFDPDQYKGKVVVATMHKAKGLEWDRVYLMSVNNYDFPSGLRRTTDTSRRSGTSATSSTWRPRRWRSCRPRWIQRVSNGTRKARPRQSARLDYVRERLRLLYVGITRARRELVVTWNTGRKGNPILTRPFVS